MYTKRIAIILTLLSFVGNIFFAESALAVNPSSPESPTIKAPFTIRNAYFNKYGSAWAAATEEQRQNFINEFNAKEKAQAQAVKNFYNKKVAEEKGLQQRLKAQDRQKAAISRAENAAKRAEQQNKRAKQRKIQALKRKMGQH